jgi:UDP-2,3-diacylglucosamine pyrophosphatase LpxH
MQNLKQKRKVDLVVISDVHLGTYGSRAKDLVDYLDSIEPKTIILNGDIIDIWQFSKRYFPESHMKVIKKVTSFLSSGTKVYYVTGNHDEMLRKFRGFGLGNFEIVNKVVLNLPTGRAWIFHGDVFDVTMKHSKWIAKLGGKGYDLLIVLNTFVNWFSMKFGKGRISLSKKIKDSVKGVVKYVNNFEQTAAEIAVENEFDYVICGHIHQPQMRKINTKKGDVMYLNSGDWVENMTALEYHNEAWKIYVHSSASYKKSMIHEETLSEALNYDVILQEIMVEISSN